MKGLVIDTTQKRGFVAAFDGDREAVAMLYPSLSTQSALIPACRQALSEIGITTAELDGIAAVVGPGSFTGIRIGVSFANAMAFALSSPRFALSAFELMRAVRPHASAYWIDAGHDSCYAAILESGVLSEKNLDKENLPEGAIDQSTILSELPKGALLAARKAFEERAFSACSPSAEVPYLKPNYMRKSQAERLKEEKK